MNEHIIFFDHECPFCWKAVKQVLEIDRFNRFLFAPLGGETAEKIFQGPLKQYATMNSLVLVEHYDSTEREIWVRSRAFWRIFWVAGNGWGLVGWISFLPCWIGDFIYRWVAEHRHQFKLKPSRETVPPDRFLP